MLDMYQKVLPKEVEIIPAVLPHNFKALKEGLERVHTFAKRVQVDVVDGHFARARGLSGKTWPYHDSSTFEHMVAEEHGLPFWDALDYEFDLMIADPAAHVMDYVRAGASHIVIHEGAEGVEDALRVLADLKGDDYGEFSIKTGLALLPDAQPDILVPLETLFDYVQVMGIDHVGRQGEPFDKKALYLVERLRQRYPGLVIQVDGGVTKETARELVKAGANRLIVGHAIFEAEDPATEYAALHALVNQS